MGKMEEALEIIRTFGLPIQQRNERSARTLLAVLDIKEGDSWSQARQRLIGIHDIIEFIATNYGYRYAENSRESIRKATLRQFNQAFITELNPDDPNRATNSSLNAYQATTEALEVIKKFGTKQWSDAVKGFIAKKGTLQERYDKTRKDNSVSVQFPNGSTPLVLSSGKHNELQKAVIEKFLPRFFPNAEVLYLGDTAHKQLFSNKKRLEELNVPITEHEELPDIVLYDKSRDVLVLIEAVTSVGPVTHTRYVTLEKVLSRCKLRRIYVSAFPDSATYKRFIDDIAWETEIWISDKPNHMIHYNGDKFLKS
jgi:adenine-specific DNA-methyltransferase